MIILFSVVFFSACAGKFNLQTPIGSFDMSVEIADKYEQSFPQEGDQFLIVHLTPTTPGITQDQIQKYVFPDDESKGIIAECEAGEYTLSSLRFVPGENGQDCIVIFEVPKELTDTAGIRIKLPAETTGAQATITPSGDVPAANTFDTQSEINQ